MAVEHRKQTLEEFLELPDEKPALELEPDGTVTQKMSPKGEHATLQLGFAELINSFARPRRLGFAWAELRTVFGGAAYVPDVSVYRWERIPRSASGRVLNDFGEPPDIAVEIVSPNQSVTSLVRKCLWYLENGVRVAALVDPDDESVIVFRPGGNPCALRGADQIDLTEVLPELRLSVEQVFAALFF